jgi:hypothetical protein
VTVFVEVSLDPAAFEYGDLLAPPAGADITVLELVPSGSTVRAYVWLQDGPGDRTAFERRVEGDDRVAGLTRLDDHDGWRLYRLSWVQQPTGILAMIPDAEATLLQASGTADGWRFKLQFPGYDAVTAFIQALTEAGVSFRLGPISEGDKVVPSGVDLTESQHEALVLARANGYFEKSRGITQEELGEALGITRQAVSYRLRGGIQSLIDATIYGDD